MLLSRPGLAIPISLWALMELLMYHISFISFYFFNREIKSLTSLKKNLMEGRSISG